jgi:hypothetical protein
MATLEETGEHVEPCAHCASDAAQVLLPDRDVVLCVVCGATGPDWPEGMTAAERWNMRGGECSDCTGGARDSDTE